MTEALSLGQPLHVSRCRTQLALRSRCCSRSERHLHPDHLRPDFDISFDTVLGSSYQLESSGDLENWGDFKTEINGTGASLTIPVLWSEVSDDSAFLRGKEITP